VRAGYHRRHAAYFRAQVDSLGLGGPRPARTLMYAPTWQDAIGSSSFFQAFASFVTQLPSEWRLIVKLHPHLERQAAAIDALAALARGRDVHLVRANPLCYPFLDLADAYVGDMSSLAYDFLAYDRPMFFTNATAGSAPTRRIAAVRLRDGDPAGALRRAVPRRRRGVDDRRRALRRERASLDAYVHAAPRDDDDLRDEMAAMLAGRRRRG
jgi:CDP-glycerol glycerophosphotransferase (TagB/SpsB family)